MLKKNQSTGLTSTVTVTKFKLRCSKYLYTLKMEDAGKAEKLRQSLPPSGCSQCFPSSARTLILRRIAALTVQDVDKQAKKSKK